MLIRQKSNFATSPDIRASQIRGSAYFDTYVGGNRGPITADFGIRETEPKIFLPKICFGFYRIVFPYDAAYTTPLQWVITAGEHRC